MLKPLSMMTFGMMLMMMMILRTDAFTTSISFSLRFKWVSEKLEISLKESYTICSTLGWGPRSYDGFRGTGIHNA